MQEKGAEGIEKTRLEGIERRELGKGGGGRGGKDSVKGKEPLMEKEEAAGGGEGCWRGSGGEKKDRKKEKQGKRRKR